MSTCCRGDDSMLFHRNFIAAASFFITDKLLRFTSESTRVKTENFLTFEFTLVQEGHAIVSQ